MLACLRSVIYRKWASIDQCAPKCRFKDYNLHTAMDTNKNGVVSSAELLSAMDASGNDLVSLKEFLRYNNPRNDPVYAKADGTASREWTQYVPSADQHGCDLPRK